MKNLPSSLVCSAALSLLFLTLPIKAQQLSGKQSHAEQAYRVCAACHGAQGQGVAALSAPALAGQNEAYIARQLAHFKNGTRGRNPEDVQGAQMRPMATALSDEDITQLAAYLSQLPAQKPVKQDTATATLQNGSNYYQANCGACHGGDAQGNPALSAPNLAILDGAYIKRQVHAYSTGLRGSAPDDRPGKQMQMMSKTLPSESHLDDVIAYITSSGQQ